MSIRASAWAWTVETTPTAKLVLVALADRADEIGLCWPSITDLAKRTCLSERAVRNAIRTLEAASIVATETRDGHSSRYRLSIGNIAEPRHEMPGLDGEPVEATPAPDAGGGGTTCRGGRHEMPGTPARRAPEPSRTTIEPSGNRQAKEIDLPDWLPLDAWADWCRHKGKKWGQGPGPARAINALNEYREQGHDPRDVIDHSLASGYAGLFPNRAKRVANGGSRLDWIMTDPIFGDSQ